MSDSISKFLSHADLNEMLSKHNLYLSSTAKEEGEIMNLTGYIIENFDFSGQDLSSINARISIFNRCKFICCDLCYTYFNGSEFIDVDFSDVVLVKAELYNVKVKNTCFDGSNLRRAEFMSTQLIDVSFRNADLGEGILSESELIRTIFDGENIVGAAIDENRETDTSWLNVNGYGFSTA
jgi:uncharacterized protein YjbI with pentapeptide repeats